MAEWSIAAVLKTVEVSKPPGVRIPLPPHQDSGFVVAFFVGCGIVAGEMAERLNAAVSKTVVRLTVDRGFESPSLRRLFGWPVCGSNY